MNPIACRVLAVALPLALALACASAKAAEPARFFTLAAEAADSVTVDAGNAVCRLLVRLSGEAAATAPDLLRCSLQLTGSANETLNYVGNGASAFAILPAQVAIASFRGSEPDKIRPDSELRAVLSVYAEPLHLVVGRNAKIGSFAELRGKRVNLGTPGSEERQLMEALLADSGLRHEDLAEASELSPMRQQAALCAGDIDAFALVIGRPSVAIARATDECGARVLALAAPVIARIAGQIPGTTATIIPKGTYATTSEDVPTIGAVAILATSAAEDEQTVYALTRTVMTHLAEVRGQQPALVHLRRERMIAAGTFMPLHPGALRYFHESGWQ